MDLDATKRNKKQRRWHYTMAYTCTQCYRRCSTKMTLDIRFVSVIFNIQELRNVFCYKSR